MVRVERIKAGHRTPIPMPEPEDGGVPGTGLTKDNVRTLEQFLVTNWVGGGLYEITVTDSTAPNAITMKWNPHWDLKQFPELTPPPLVSAMTENAGNNNNVVNLPVAPSSTPFSRSQMPPNAFPNGFPQVQPQMAYAQQQPAYYPQLPPPPPVTSPAYGVWAGEADRRKQEEELRTLREENAKREREAADARHKAEMDRVRLEAQAKADAAQRDFDRRFAELQATIEKTTAQLTAAQSRPAVDPQIEMLKEQARRAEEKADREAAQREADRRDAQLQMLIKSQADESNRRMEQMQQMHQASMTQMQTMITQLMQASASKPDAMQPIITLMQEQARSNADAIKEVARQQSDSLNKMQAFMMNPRDMVALARESQATSDQASERMQRSFDRVFEIQSKAVENVLQMNQGGSQTAELVGMGIEKITGIADRWIGGKSATEKFQLEAQRSLAESQARAIEAQAAVELSRAGAVVTPPPAPQGQLNGVPMPQQQAATPTINAEALPKVPTFGKSKNSKPVANGNGERKILGLTDREWFGEALLENVLNTRAGVDYFHESARKGRFDKLKRDVDGTPMPEGYSAPEVVMGLMQAITMIEQARQQMGDGILPPAVRVLYQERYADFVDILLPDASQKFRDDVVQGLIEAIKTATGETPNPKPATVPEIVEASDDGDDADEDDDEDDDEDEDDGGDAEDPDKANDGKVVTVKPKPNGRARA